ncbi:MAG: hypothetical protein P8Z80_00800 [Pseudolabrys sp.]|jgi:hypothetical protein
MTRYFFDIINNAACTHDFHGRYFWSAEEARDMAEAVSMDMACSEKDECAGFEIQVRDVKGTLVFSVPVRAAEAVFA